jgi:hypothetical protein
VTYDKLGDLGEEWRNVLYPKNDLPKYRERIKRVVEAKGPEFSQELADKLLEKDGEKFERPHEIISRQVDLARMRRK